MMTEKRDHGGGLDAAIATFGGVRAGWLDLSTGINPQPYPLPAISDAAWNTLPDSAAVSGLCDAARAFWNVPDRAEILPTHGASAAIARLPGLVPSSRVRIDSPTYNEHAAAFRNHGWRVAQQKPAALVAVHPNNPDGRLWSEAELTAPFTVIDESFCDVTPDKSHIALAGRPGLILLKSFGKFWGRAGLRLGFVIGDPDLIADLREMLGPWSVSGPAIEIGTAALNDQPWADATRRQLATDAARLDQLMTAKGATPVGGTDLFRLYDVGKAADWHEKLAEGHVLSRIFPYSDRWLRLGLPAADRWDQLEAAL